MAKVILRDLFVRIGFDVDAKALDELNSGINTMKSSVKKLTIALAAATAGLIFFLNEGGKFEQAQIAFEVMLGSAERAGMLIKDLFEFAAKTPFQIPDLIQNSKLLLGMGITVEKIIPTLNDLGNVAAGLGVPIERLALNFGQVRAQSKLTGRELRDFAVAGVPLLDVLSKQLGKSTAEILTMVSAGDIGFADVEEAFRRMAGAGGRFNNLMIRQSKTLLGAWSNFRDQLTIIAIDIGKSLLPEAKAFLATIMDFVAANEAIIKTNLVNWFRALLRAIIGTFIWFRDLFRITNSVLESFGGMKDILLTLIKLFLILFGIQFLSGLGTAVIAVVKITRAFIALSTAMKVAQLTALAIPILIGAAIAALGLIAEDILAFFQGKSSITGLLVEKVKEVLPIIVFLFDFFIEKLKESLKAKFQAIRDDIFLVWMQVKKDFSTFVDDMVSRFQPLFDVFEKIREGGQGFAKFARGVFGVSETVTTQGSPTASPVLQRTGQIVNQNDIRVNSPITVSVPEGTPANQVAPAVQSGIRESLDNLLRQTARMTEPAVEF